MRKLISAIVVGSLLTMSMTTMSFATPLGDAAVAVKACKTDVDCATAIAALKAASVGLSRAKVASLLVQAETRIAANLGVTVEELRASAVMGPALNVAFADIDIADIQTAAGPDAVAECTLDSASATDGGGC